MSGRADEGLPETRGGGHGGPAILDGAIDVIDWIGRLICAVTLATLFVALLINVVLRYVFDSGITWVYELHAILLPWLVAGGVIIAAARGRHIAVTLLPDALAPRARTAAFGLVDLILLVIAISVIWSSQPILKASQYQTLSSINITQIWGYASIIAAFGGIALIAFLDFLRLAIAGQRRRAGSQHQQPELGGR